VSSIGGDLNIGIKFNLVSYPNTALTSLTGLEGLTSIGETLVFV